jgi:hypothetical protein
VTVLRTSCGQGVLAASAINAVQFVCAIVGKLLSGALLACEAPAARRAISRVLFVAAPLAFCTSHLVLFDVRLLPLLSGEIGRAVTFSHSTPRLYAYALVVGLPFGLLFGTLQVPSQCVC